MRLSWSWNETELIWEWDCVDLGMRLSWSANETRLIWEWDCVDLGMRLGWSGKNYKLWTRGRYPYEADFKRLRSREEDKMNDIENLARVQTTSNFSKGVWAWTMATFCVFNTIICHVRIFPLQEREDELREQMRKLREMSVISYQAAS